MPKTSLYRSALVSISAIALYACSGSPEEEIGADSPNTIKLTSSAFETGSRIPDKHTCEGEDISPALHWDNVPDGTQSFALISTDYDAPSPNFPLFEIIHWTMANIPTDMRALPEGFIKIRKTENGIYQGNKTGGDIGYYGPCPPFGEHTYYFTIYALDTMLEMPQNGDNISKSELLKKMEGHILAKGVTYGTYSR